MHVVLINCIGYLLDTLIDVLKPRQLLELDRRNKSLPQKRKYKKKRKKKRKCEKKKKKKRRKSQK